VNGQKKKMSLKDLLQCVRDGFLTHDEARADLEEEGSEYSESESSEVSDQTYSSIAPRFQQWDPDLETDRDQLCGSDIVIPRVRIDPKRTCKTCAHRMKITSLRFPCSECENFAHWQQAPDNNGFIEPKDSKKRSIDA